MKIRILFDKYAEHKRLHTGWGVSFLVGEKILFDAGEKGLPLLENMKNLNIDIGRIEYVIISHDHWDHKGGLSDILEKNSNIRVYVCPGFGAGFKNEIRSHGVRLIEAGSFAVVSGNVYTTGEIGGRYAFRYMPEQALVLETNRGLSVLTGCAHPGIIKIIEYVKRNISGDIYLVLGGFHMMDKSKRAVRSVIDGFRRLDVKKAAPTHCTGEDATAAFRKTYGNDFVEVKVGRVIEV